MSQNPSSWQLLFNHPDDIQNNKDRFISTQPVYQVQKVIPQIRPHVAAVIEADPAIFKCSL